MVSRRDSVFGIMSLGKSSYFFSLPGQYGCLSSREGGRTSRERLHCWTNSSPKVSAICDFDMPVNAPYIRSFSWYSLWTGRYIRFISLSKIHADRIDRFSREVYTTSGLKPLSSSSLAARLISAQPFGVISGSAQPVNVLFGFQCDSPCRNSISVPGFCFPLTCSFLVNARGVTALDNTRDDRENDEGGEGRLKHEGEGQRPLLSRLAVSCK
mmetsp:Transcript_11756/g.18681  ORF Transcript_11756/g.18681 Transcript_11756/m.18681 type:complete len:212 (-) Transcript_11756:133-768(-)